MAIPEKKQFKWCEMLIPSSTIRHRRTAAVVTRVVVDRAGQMDRAADHRGDCVDRLIRRQFSAGDQELAESWSTCSKLGSFKQWRIMRRGRAADHRGGAVVGAIAVAGGTEDQTRAVLDVGWRRTPKLKDNRKAEPERLPASPQRVPFSLSHLRRNSLWQ